MIKKLGGRKFTMALVGIGLCLVWAVFKLEKEYLMLALGFVTLFTGANVIQKFTKE